MIVQIKSATASDVLFSTLNLIISIITAIHMKIQGTAFITYGTTKPSLQTRGKRSVGDSTVKMKQKMSNPISNHPRFECENQMYAATTAIIKVADSAL